MGARSPGVPAGSGGYALRFLALFQVRALPQRPRPPPKDPSRLPRGGPRFPVGAPSALLSLLSHISPPPLSHTHSRCYPSQLPITRCPFHPPPSPLIPTPPALKLPQDTTPSPHTPPHPSPQPQLALFVIPCPDPTPSPPTPAPLSRHEPKEEPSMDRSPINHPSAKHH